MSRPAALVVVSYYDRRPPDDLVRLLASLRTQAPGAPFDIAVVINRDGGAAPDLSPDIAVHIHENIGMNIGAWEHGWRSSPGYQSYLFLQDECRAERGDWLSAFLTRAADPAVGLVGESLNAGWDKPWAEIAEERRDEVLRDHLIGGAPSARVPTYLDFLARQGIDPGPIARHLRSVVWCARRDVLEAINGFPIGANYGECIAAEIGVSRKIETKGLRVEQVAEKPFTYFSHPQYPRDSIIQRIIRRLR